LHIYLDNGTVQQRNGKETIVSKPVLKDCLFAEERTGVRVVAKNLPFRPLAATISSKPQLMVLNKAAYSHPVNVRMYTSSLRHA